MYPLTALLDLLRFLCVSLVKLPSGQYAFRGN